MDTSIFWGAVMGGFLMGTGVVLTLCPLLLGAIK